MTAAEHARTRALADTYDPLPGDEARYLTAIGRRNTTWARLREAEELLRQAEAGPATRDLRPYRRHFNDSQDDYERAHYDLIRERVRFRESLRMREWRPLIGV